METRTQTLANIIATRLKQTNAWTKTKELKQIAKDRGHHRSTYYRAIDLLTASEQIHRKRGYVKHNHKPKPQTKRNPNPKPQANINPDEYNTPQYNTRRYAMARAKAFHKTDGLCALCGVKQATDAHHWHYPPPDELNERHLTPLCRACHALATGLREHYLKQDK